MFLRRFQRLFFICLVSMVLFLIVHFVHKRYNKDIELTFTNDHYTDTCVLPKMDPFDPSIMKFVHKLSPIVCAKSPSLVFLDSEGMLHINQTVSKQQQYSNTQCSYSIIDREGDYNISTGPEIPLISPTNIHADFFRVKCMLEEEIIYDFIHHKVDYKSNVETGDENQNQLSVYMFGFDSTSRLAAERKLRKTLKYLENDLSGYIMKGYTKVAENTFPNLLAVLTGRKPYSKELPPYTEILDPYPFIWKNFSANDYITFLAEDCTEMPSFNYWKGFGTSPCDHYMRPFQLAIRQFEPFARKAVHQKVFDVLTTSGKSLCYGSTPRHNLVINYYKQFLSSYKNKRKFALSWLTDLSHEDSNRLGLADTDVREFFKWMKESGRLNNAVLILFSDHGAIMNNIRNTPIGRIENRMPLLGIVIPDNLKKVYPNIHNNLLINRERLSSPYDLYQTLADILHRRFDKKQLQTKPKQFTRGLSLFLELPNDRSCYDAGIDGHYCPCDTLHKTSVTKNEVKTIANYVVQTLNGYVSQAEEMCAQLRLYQIMDASVSKSNLHRNSEKEEFSLRHLFSYSNILIYQILIETLPGNGLFEATVQYNGYNKMKILGEISRTNRYGNQSICAEKSLRPYCFCIT